MFGCGCWLFFLLARATESWLGGFYCMFPVLVASFVGWIRPDSAIGAVVSLAAPVRVQFNFTSLYLTFLSLVTWLKALGTSRKKKEVFGHLKGSPFPKKILVEAATDNLATEHISLKESSNKFPLAFIQMQLSLKCYLKGLVFRLQWRSCKTNQKADDLTNEEFGKFEPRLRCKVAWENFGLVHLESASKIPGEGKAKGRPSVSCKVRLQK